MSTASSNAPAVPPDPPQPDPGPADGPFKGVNWSPFRAVLVTIGAFFAAQLFGSLILGIVLGFMGWNDERILDWFTTVDGQFSYVLIAEAVTMAVLLWVMRRGRSGFRALGFHRDVSLKDIGYTLAGFGVYFVLFIIAVVLSQVLFGVDVEQKQDLGFNEVVSRPHMIMAFISLVVLPPIVEEIVFRGYLYGGLRRKVSMTWAMVITSFLFAAPHLLEGEGGSLIWIAAIDTFVLSMVLCYLREKTGNLWASIFVHAIKNGWAFAVLYIIAR